MEINDTAPQDTLETIFKENDFYYDYDCTSNPWTAEIRVTYGDWKHDHLRLNYIMSKNNYIFIKENEIGTSDDDSYSSTHYFKYGG